VVDRAVLKIKEQDGDAESATSLPVGGPVSGTWMPASGTLRRQTIDRGADTSVVINQQATVGPPASAYSDMQRYQWSTWNAGYSSAHRRNVMSFFYCY